MKTRPLDSGAVVTSAGARWDPLVKQSRGCDAQRKGGRNIPTQPIKRLQASTLSQSE